MTKYLTGQDHEYGERQPANEFFRRDQPQELLGHRSVKMTERYARLSPDAKRSVVAHLDDDLPH